MSLEGPAGVGKSTLVRELGTRLRLRGVKAHRIQEFSDSPTGRLLRQRSSFGASKEPYLEGLAGRLLYLSDRVYQLARFDDEVLLADRGLLTELVFSRRFPGHESPGQCEERLVANLVDWMVGSFAEDSMVVLLHAPIEVLQRRLTRRLRRILTAVEVRRLEKEIAEYDLLASGSAVPWRLVRVDADRNLAATADDLLLAGGWE